MNRRQAQGAVMGDRKEMRPVYDVPFPLMLSFAFL